MTRVAGWTGMRLGVVAYILPFMFVYHPALILRGDVGEIVIAVFTASIGVILLSIAFAGYLFRPLGWGARLLAIAAGSLLITAPLPGIPEVLTDAVGLVLGVVFVLLERAAVNRRLPEPAPLQCNLD